MRSIAQTVLRIAVCVAAVLAIVAVFQFRLIVVKDQPLTVALAGLIAVLIVSVAWGRKYAIFLSILATLWFAWLVPPGGGFHFEDQRDWLALATFLITGVVASELVERVRRKTRDADERRAEAARSEKELRSVIKTIPAMVWSALPDGSNVLMNQRWADYTGLSAAGLGWQAAIHLPEAMSS